MNKAAADGSIRGVIGVLDGPLDDTEQLERLRALGLGGVEVRADLWLAPRPRGRGRSVAELLVGITTLLEHGAPVLFTVRHASQGGAFDGAESDRVDLYRQAIAAGVAAIDVEWGTEACRALAREAPFLVASHHDFAHMLDRAALDRLALEVGDTVGEMAPTAIKIVPTAAVLADSAILLDWVASAPDTGPRRIGFAMGIAGVPSRILALARGSLLTYAGVAAAVAPGQLPIHDLLETYRAHRIGAATRLFGLAASAAIDNALPGALNRRFAAGRLDAVCIPLPGDRLDAILPATADLAVEAIVVAEHLAVAPDRRARSTHAQASAGGAARIVRIDRDPVSEADLSMLVDRLIDPRSEG